MRDPLRAIRVFHLRHVAPGIARALMVPILEWDTNPPWEGTYRMKAAINGAYKTHFLKSVTWIVVVKRLLKDSTNVPSLNRKVLMRSQWRNASFKVTATATSTVPCIKTSIWLKLRRTLYEDNFLAHLWGWIKFSYSIFYVDDADFHGSGREEYHQWA